MLQTLEQAVAQLREEGEWLLAQAAELYVARRAWAPMPVKCDKCHLCRSCYLG